MVNLQNLVDLRTRTPQERRAISSKGGKVRSAKKRWARRLMHMKRKGLTDESYKLIVAWMEEPESSALDIYLYLEKVKLHCKTPSQMSKVAQTQIQLMRAHHGDKIKTENVHHLVNWSIEDKENTIKRLLDEDNTTTISENNKK